MLQRIFAELAGRINIPTKAAPWWGSPERAKRSVLGMRTGVHPHTATLAVTLVGAAIPTAFSMLVVEDSIWSQPAVGTAVVTLIVHLIALCAPRGDHTNGPGDRLELTG